MGNIVELRDVSKRYAVGEIETEVLKKVNVEIEEGEFISIAGPSGSGKSTMLHMIGALDRPTSGKVLIKGEDVAQMNDDELAMLRGRTVGFVFQTFNLISRLTALENVILPMIFSGIDHGRKEKAEELLKKVGLGHRINNKPTQLSGGERQRVAIARALANEPEIIVADEPTGNLDSKTGETIIDILREINKGEGKTLIIVTHDEKVAKTAKRRIEILDGAIV